MREVLPELKKKVEQLEDNMGDSGFANVVPDMTKKIRDLEDFKTLVPGMMEKITRLEDALAATLAMTGKQEQLLMEIIQKQNKSIDKMEIRLTQALRMVNLLGEAALKGE
jgi:hypothetical protein